jgi:uncharacterized repeat protein (TIGR01451 family)
MAAALLIRSRGLLVALIAGLTLAGTALAEASPAQAAGSWWRLASVAAPTNLPSGGEAKIVATASNLGYEDAAAGVTISDRLPEGVTLVPGSVRGVQPGKGGTLTREGTADKLTCEEAAPVVSCTTTTPVTPYGAIELIATVKVTASVSSTLQNEVTLSGGTPTAPLLAALDVSGSPTGFGVQNYSLVPESESGAVETQAGKHPFQLTTTLEMNQIPKVDPGGVEVASGTPALLRDLHFVLPPGLLGNVNVLPRCTTFDFSTIAGGATDLCPADTAIGVARVVINEPNTLHGVLTEIVPIFNLEPAPGEPARFGFEFNKVTVALTTAVRTGSDYAVEVSSTNVSQAAEVLGTQVTFWGQPGAPAHDAARGWECVDDEKYKEEETGRPCLHDGQATAPPFLTLPTSCPIEAPVTTVTGRSWPIGERREEFSIGGESAATFRFPALTGCELLGFEPSLAVEPTTHAASTPTGLNVKVDVPQASTLSPTGLAEADLRETVVSLPAGVMASPGAANGLEVCPALSSAAPFGFGFLGSPESAQLNNEDISPDAEQCPNGSKLGTVSIKTPLLKNELHGTVYLAAQDVGAPGEETGLLEERLVLYLTAYDEESGVRVKLAGDVHVDPSTGNLTSTFKNTPQVPFEDLTIDFFEGSTATQSTPSQCGSYASRGSFVPWSGQATAQAGGSFAISEGPGGGGCPNPGSFGPSFNAGATNTQAGEYTEFSMTIGHSDADQPLSGLTLHLPPGAAAMLSHVNPCPEPGSGQEWNCGSDSEVGHSTSTSGLGGSPYSLPGKVYLTTGYGGAPFGLLVVTPADAGPFHLGNVDVRSKIFVDRSTAAVTIVSDPFPQFVRGVPVQLKQINVTVSRPDFEFNPTNCGGLSVTGTITGSRGASAGVSSPYGVTGCAALPFKPTLTASTKGNASKPNGAELRVKVTSAPGQANIAKTKLVLPITLPSRLTTIQKACPDSTFEANPAACDEGSNIGTATVHTPVLKSPLTGPAYLVSHGNAAFPDIEFVLQGEGITLVLDGQTDIKKGITTSTFNAVPDAPVTTFETVLPEGPHSALTSNVPESKHFSLCGQKLVIPTTITGQNGIVIEQQTKVPVEGCAVVKASKESRTTKLAKALKKCRKQFKHSKKKRASCEAMARKKYGAKKAKKSKKKAAKKK